MNLIQELQWRGLIQDIIPGTEELLLKEKVSGYVGFDPTSDSLHIGSLVPIILLMHLQRAGHKPYALVGGATGMVGDPSGKSEERNMLDEEVIRYNTDCIARQLGHFLYFDAKTENAAVVVNNYDWFKEFTFLQFIRDVGKYITVNYMLAKDSVQKRLETGMSFTEFTYQLVQGYDFFYLHQKHNIQLQMGGSDQWGNIVTGTELIRKKAGGEAFAFTAPLLKKADGGKFGKTESGNIWLDRTKTSPYKFYQFWMNTSDADATNYIRIFTFLSQTAIEDLIREHETDPGKRILQKKLAEELTCLVHSRTDYEESVKASQLLFSDNTADQLTQLSEEQLLDILDGLDRHSCPFTELQTGIPAISLLADTGIFPSKGEARKMIQQGGVSLNKIKLNDPNELITSERLLNGKYLLIQKGKKKQHLIIAS